MSSLELRYAPRQCKYFCCGDCCYPDIKDDLSCSTDYPECSIAEHEIIQPEATRMRFKAG